MENKHVTTLADIYNGIAKAEPDQRLLLKVYLDSVVEVDHKVRIRMIAEANGFKQSPVTHRIIRKP